MSPRELTFFTLQTVFIYMYLELLQQTTIQSRQVKTCYVEHPMV